MGRVIFPSAMTRRMSKLPIPALSRRIISLTARTWPAENPEDELPLLHRLAIIYLILPVVIWLLGWFHWWFGIPAAVLILLAFRPALSGSVRLSPPRPVTLAILLVAAAWVMSTAAGGVFDTQNWDWHKHRSMLLNLVYYPWPTFIRDPLAAYLPAEFNSPHLLRYYLGWYIVPGSVARLFGPAVLNWTVPLWTWLGVALIILLFVRERRGWGVVFAVVIFIFFGGLDFLRGIFLEAVAGSIEHIEWKVEAQYSTNMRSLSWTPQHFVPAGLYTFLLLQLGRAQRFLGVSAVLLAAAPFWSSLVAIGLLPLVAALLWKNGFHPFLKWPNLALAAPLAGLTAIYLTSGSLDHNQGWVWGKYDWPVLARWIPTFYLTEFLLLVLLLCALRPGLLRKPFFIASLATLILLPLYHYGKFNDLTLQGSIPAILVLCYYCTETICEQMPAIYDGAVGSWKRLGLAGIAVTLAIGSIPAVPELTRAASSFGPFRYEQFDYAVTLDVPLEQMDQYIVRSIPSALQLLLDADDFLAEDGMGEPVTRSHVDIYFKNDAKLSGFSQPFSMDTAATLAATRRMVRAEQEPIFVAGRDYDDSWAQLIFSDPSEAPYIRTFDPRRSFIFPSYHASASYLFAFDLPHASLIDRYFDESAARIVGTAPSGRPITLHRLLDPRPSFQPEIPLPAQFGDQLFVYGFDLPKDARSGEKVTVRWYWRLLAADQREFALTNQLFGVDDRRWAQLDDRGFAPGYWPAGTSGISTFEIDIDASTPTGAYWLRVAMYDRNSQEISNLPVFDAQGNQAGNQLMLGPIKVHGRPPVPSSKEPVSSPSVPDFPLPARFDDQIDLQGYSLSVDRLLPGESLDLTLFWAPRGRPMRDYTVFVHLLDSQGQIRGQADSPPRSGKYPTSVWDAGELIADLHTLLLAPDLPAGKYSVTLGLYDPETGLRVPTVDENGKALGDLVMIAELIVGRK